ncbi:MAG: TlpA family protein disulfide reductase [Roseiflexus sp.]|nr:TlpA family protein disulfide reductase [Roseiflexus sp.]MCS7290764.1 TlpA family protein disulfide reductase [Roseiflexus sp.]MDW8146220.1 redoxin domain-containing protein [Roseiflexaceae bacterium]MDW8231393.1 redoxin domain-containing protein [Roseiflexaceae bacterium]
MTFSRHIWDLLLVATLLFGSVFIWTTRITPNAAATTPAPQSAVAQPAPRIGHPAPEFALTAVNGSQVALSDLRGQVVLINFWATWCPPCRAEMPAIQQAYDRFRDQGFLVLAVNQQEDAASVAKYMSEQRLTFPALLDSDARVSTDYQARVLPSSFFVDRRGIIRAVYRGPMSRGMIEGAIEQLIAETP